MTCNYCGGTGKILKGHLSPDQVVALVNDKDNKDLLPEFIESPCPKCVTREELPRKVSGTLIRSLRILLGRE